jgi:hypothetical protein
MAEKFKWKGEVIFEGTAKEFNKLSEALSGMAEVVVRCPHGWPPVPFPGYPPWPWWRRMGEASVNKYIEGGEKLQIKWIKDIRGGIRGPHLHLENEVVLMGRDKFKMMVKDVASTLAEDRVDRGGEFIDVMNDLKILSATPIEIP